MSGQQLVYLGGDVAAAIRAASAAPHHLGTPVPRGLTPAHEAVMASAAAAAAAQHHAAAANLPLSLHSQYAASHQLAKYPEVGLFSQLGQLFPKSGTAPHAPESQPKPKPGGASEAAKSSYATRHQAAEARRRTRINDR